MVLNEERGRELDQQSRDIFPSAQLELLLEGNHEAKGGPGNSSSWSGRD